MTWAVAGWYLLGLARSGAVWALDLLRQSELARWVLAAAVVWYGWGLVSDRAHEEGVREERARNDEMVRLEVERQRGVASAALAEAQAMAERAEDDRARWERQASLAEARAAVLAGKACLPKGVVDAIRDIR